MLLCLCGAARRRRSKRGGACKDGGWPGAEQRPGRLCSRADSAAPRSVGRGLEHSCAGAARGQGLTTDVLGAMLDLRGAASPHLPPLLYALSA